MSWTEQDLRAALREQVEVVPVVPGRAAAVRSRIDRRRRTTAAAALAALAIVVLLAVGSAVGLDGQDRSLPDTAPHGADGTIVYADGAGELHGLDPITGTSWRIVAGSGRAAAPVVAPDGDHVAFVREDEGAIYLARKDGTVQTLLGSTSELDQWDFSWDGRRIAAVSRTGVLGIVDVSTGQRRVLRVDHPIRGVFWTGPHSLLVLGRSDGTGLHERMWTLSDDGSGEAEVVAPGLCCSSPVVLRGTGTVAWASWDDGSAATARIHVFDLSSGTDRTLAPTDVDGSIFLTPTFSPDGRWLVVERHPVGGDSLQLMLVAADGSGEARRIGPLQDRNQSGAVPVFSPDGTKLLVLYADDRSAWLFDIPAGTGTKTSWTGLVSAAWMG